MGNELKTQLDARSAIEFSCLPLLCGEEGRIRRTARELYRTYRLRSYAMIPPGCRLHGFRKLLPSPTYLHRIPIGFSTPSLLADMAIRFFDTAPPSTIPVLIDCTGGLLLDDPEAAERLSTRIFAIPDGKIATSPPFCYAEPTHERSTET